MRTLQGEWVVGNDVWKRLKTERRARWHAEIPRRAPTGLSRLREADGVGSATSSPAPSARRVATVEDVRDSGRGTPEPELEGEAAVPTSRRERVIYYVHGGAYYVGNAATHRLVTIGVSKACNARVFGKSLDAQSDSSHYIPSRSRVYVSSATPRRLARLPPPPSSSTVNSAREHYHHG